MDHDGRGRGEELGGVEGGKLNQDVWYEKKIYFQQLEKIENIIGNLRNQMGNQNEKLIIE